MYIPSPSWGRWECTCQSPGTTDHICFYATPSILVHMNTNCLSEFYFWLDVCCTFGTDNTHHIHNKRQRHIPLPTPIVRRHAEACLSTTRAKHKRARTFAVAARWAGVIPQLKNRPAGWVLPAVQNQKYTSRKRPVKRAIFLFNR